MQFALQYPMTVFCRIRGPNGRIRELKGLFDFNFQYCLMLRQDAIDIGYPEASYALGPWRDTRPDRAPMVVTLRGIERTMLFNIEEVAVGALAAENVAAVILEYDYPSLSTVDIILGWAFLQNFRLTLDPKSRTLNIE